MADAIFHIAGRGDWDKREDGTHVPAAFHQDGFIHSSKLTQVLGVANALFRGQQGLLLLRIDPSRLAADVRFENLDGGPELFPHIYGPLDLEAVIAVHDFAPAEDGSFVLPPGLGA